MGEVKTMIDFGRDICNNLPNAERREWLVTNGIGGYASGTIAGFLTRRYHGLLLAALQPPVGRTLMVSKLDETVTYDGQTYALHANRWAGGVVDPHGFHYIERFRLEGTTPVWTFAFADALLEKRIWMQPGVNTTYVQYQFRRGRHPLTFTARALVDYRNHHDETTQHEWHMQIELIAHGLKITAYEGATPFYLYTDRAQATPQHEWYRRFFLMREANRGLVAIEDHLYAGDFYADMTPGETLTFVCTTEASPNLDGTAAYQLRYDYEQQLLARADIERCAVPTSRPVLEQLVLAADQFIVKRPLPRDSDGRSILAGYHWFSDWGRDTMIALAGLTLTNGRADVAAKILRTFAFFVDEGMLPNRFPDMGTQPEYNTADATLWYFEALRAYHAATGDKNMVRELFPVFQDIIAWHQRGTRYNIHVDAEDGLLYAGGAGHQLTWMDVKIDDWVVTARTGKAVEINALWYNALCSMVEFARLLKFNSRAYNEMAQKAKASFERFWSDDLGYCYDVIDAPTDDGGVTNDASLRPNQLLAVSLPYSPLTAEQQKAVVDVCARHLLTSHGLRSLAPGHPSYISSYGGDPGQRDSAYHQGTVWTWLIGPFVIAHLRVYNDPAEAHSFLVPLFHHLESYGLGTISEIADGDVPFTPRGCIAQAWSVAELLRACRATTTPPQPAL